MQTALLMAPLHFLGQDAENEVQHHFFVTLHYWHQLLNNMMLMAFSITPLYCSCPDDLSGVPNDYLVM